MRFADLDAVTVDAFGTLVRLADPVPALERALRARGVQRSREEIAAAFRAEVRYYVEHKLEGRDAESLARLRSTCAGVFLDALGAGLDPEEFAPGFVGALEFEPLPGAVETLTALRLRGLRLAVVSNWDVGLGEHLAGLGLDGLFGAVVSSAEAGAEKPDPAPFLLALERLCVEPERALHVGDGAADEAGARAAGMRFAAAPLPRAFAGWT